MIPPSEPAQARALTAEGLRLHQQGNLVEAQARYRQALDLAPDDADALHLFALSLAQGGDPARALEVFEIAVSANPYDAAVFNNYGNALRDLGNAASALSRYDAALKLNPYYAEAHHNRATALKDIGRGEEALASYAKAISLRPDYVEARYSRGVLLQEMKRLVEARGDYEAVLRLDPAHVFANWNRSLLDLLSGDYDRGLAGYEWRWQNHRLAVARNQRTFAAPRWTGREPLEGRTILLHAEQGLGDTIQFCRYAPLVAARGARVVLEAQRSLVGLLRTLPDVALVLAYGEDLPPLDFQCPLLSLPLAFGTTVATIPAAQAYLAADAAKVAQWRGRLGPRTRPRIGVVWGTSTMDDAGRSMPFAQMQRLLSPRWQLVSLQKEAKPEERGFLAASADAIDVGMALNDFTDTAAVVELVDLVVSIDTSVVHVAGALGKPVWVLLPYANDWRWLLDRDDSPWYPTARLFRQEAPGAWAAAVDRVLQELERRFPL